MKTWWFLALLTGVACVEDPIPDGQQRRGFPCDVDDDCAGEGSTCVDDGYSRFCFGPSTCDDD